MITRKDYLDGKSTHDEYYAQFVTRATVSAVASRIGVDRIKASADRSFNDIPLQSWDEIPTVFITSKMRECGDYPTPAGLVCINKRAAKMIRDGETPCDT